MSYLQVCRKYHLFIWMVLLSCSCGSKKPLPIQEYTAYINNPENGLLLAKEQDGIRFTLKYIPAQLSAYREFQEQKDTSLIKDLQAKYQQHLSFQLFIEAVDPNLDLKALIQQNATTRAEVESNYNSLFFDMSKYCLLKTAHGTYAPVASNVENAPGLNKRINMQLVFSGQALMKEFNTSDGLFGNENEWEFVLDDPFFEYDKVIIPIDINNLKQSPLLQFI
jgi:hypothetical protein